MIWPVTLRTMSPGSSLVTWAEKTTPISRVVLSTKAVFTLSELATTSPAHQPQTGNLSGPGIAFYTTTFDLDLPTGYDIPLAFSFSNGTSNATSPQATYTFTNGTARPAAYRCQLFVNGYQFGKYVHNVGPQDVFPVPEGIWNYQGSNTVAVSLWVQEEDGAKVESLSLVTGPVIRSGFGVIEPAPQPEWVEREGVY
jgi:hypothetical protein